MFNSSNQLPQSLSQIWEELMIVMNNKELINLIISLMIDRISELIEIGGGCTDY